MIKNRRIFRSCLLFCRYLRAGVYTGGSRRCWKSCWRFFCYQILLLTENYGSASPDSARNCSHSVSMLLGRAKGKRCQKLRRHKKIKGWVISYSYLRGPSYCDSWRSTTYPSMLSCGGGLVQYVISSKSNTSAKTRGRCITHLAKMNIDAYIDRTHSWRVLNSLSNMLVLSSITAFFFAFWRRGTWRCWETRCPNHFWIWYNSSNTSTVS